jgi:hypothetical protein
LDFLLARATAGAGVVERRYSSLRQRQASRTALKSNRAEHGAQHLFRRSSAADSHCEIRF